MPELEQNKALVREFIDQVFVKGNKAVVDQLVAADFVGHAAGPGNDMSREDLAQTVDRVFAALDDVTFDVQDVVAEGDRVAVRLVSSATQTGAFMGMPATGKRYTVEEIHVFRVTDARIAEHWHQFDQMGLMKQLGAQPGKG